MVPTSAHNTTIPWYVAGLAFECLECGNCCAGPCEGYVWVSDGEIGAIAEFLGIKVVNFRKQYVRKECGKLSLVEKPSRDCIFLTDKKCLIYPVRPAQCRTWPFWPTNLHTPDDWCSAGQRCPGINRGTIRSFDEIRQATDATPG